VIFSLASCTFNIIGLTAFLMSNILDKQRHRDNDHNAGLQIATRLKLTCSLISKKMAKRTTLLYRRGIHQDTVNRMTRHTKSLTDKLKFVQILRVNEWVVSKCTSAQLGYTVPFTVAISRRNSLYSPCLWRDLVKHFSQPLSCLVDCLFIVQSLQWSLESSMAIPPQALGATQLWTRHRMHLRCRGLATASKQIMKLSEKNTNVIMATKLCIINSSRLLATVAMSISHTGQLTGI